MGSTRASVTIGTSHFAAARRALTPLPVHLFLSTATLLLALAAFIGASSASAATGTQAPRRERVEQCNWDRPGHSPFMGDVVAAIDRYSDIPTAVRVRLKQRMQARQYDEMVVIRRDSIVGREAYEPTIRDMHFGLDRVCHQVSRTGWTPQMHERGLVYCEQGHCILIPTVCRNVSRIVRGPSALAGAPGGETPLDVEAQPPASAGPTATSSELFAPAQMPPGDRATSSFSEAVAGAALSIGPVGFDGDPLSGNAAGAGGSEGSFGSLAGLPGTGGFDGNGAADGLAEPEGRGGNSSSGPLTGAPGGGFGGGFPGADGGGGGFGLAPPLAAIPEPSTWASLLAGVVLLVLVNARRSRRRCASAH